MARGTKYNNVHLQGNVDVVEKEDSYRILDYRSAKDSKGRVVKTEVMIENPDKSRETFIELGSDEDLNVQNVQALLAKIYGSRKSSEEAIDPFKILPTGEIRDVITPDELREMR